MRDTDGLRGVYPVLQTPFDAAGEIDLGVLSAEVDWVLAQGADGVAIGMVSEVLRLSSEERDQLTTAVCKVAAPAGVVVSVVAGSTHTARRYARHAEDQGAAAVMAAPPPFVTASTEELLRFFESVLTSVAIPALVQDASGYIGSPLSLELQARLCAEFGDRVLFKPEATPIGPRLSALRDATASRARVFEGTGGIALIDSYHRGVVGTMPAADLCWAVAALWAALEAGETARAYAISLPLGALISLQRSLDAFVSVEKWLLRRQGVFPDSAGQARGPLDFALDEETVAEVERLFELVQQAVAR